MKRKLRSCLAVVLTFATVATSIPTSAFAADLETETNTEVTTEAVSESQVAAEEVATETNPSSEDSTVPTEETVETKKEETEAKVETETVGSVESTEAKETKKETEAAETNAETVVETETEAATVTETETEIETEEIKGLVKITVSEGGKVVLKDANGNTIREVAYADTVVEPVKYEAKEGTVVKIEVIANGEKNFEVGTYKNTLDSGAVTEETHVPEGTERIERTITLSRNTQNINVVFDEVEVETETESESESETETESVETETESETDTETETETVVETETESETVAETETETESETETKTVVETETETETAVVETEVESGAEETEEVQYTNFTVKGNGTVSIHVNGKQTAVVSSGQTVGVKSELLKSGDITAVMMPDEENVPYRVKWNGSVVDEDCLDAVDENGDYTYYIFEPSGDFEFEFITYEEAAGLVEPYGDGSLLDGGWLKKLLDNAQDGTTYKNMKVGTKYSTKSTFVSQLDVHSSYASQGGYVEVQDTTTDFANTFGTRFWMTTCGSSTANPCPSVGDTGTLYAYIASRTSDSVEVRVAFINDNGYHQNVYCNYTLTIPDSQKVSIVIQKRLANSDRADTHLYTLDATFKVINDSTKKEVGRITTDSKTGIGTLELDDITKKTSFTIKEVKAPKYATIKSASMNCTVAPGESAKVVCTDYPYFGIVYVDKVFTDKKYHSFLNDCVFGIWDNAKCEGKPLETATISGPRTKINRWLAFGRWYYIKEISVPKDSGLVLSEKITKVRFTEDDLPTVTLKDQDSNRIIPKDIISKNDKPGPVKVRVRKSSNLYGAELPWLDKYPTLYSLKGAEFTFYWDKACTDEIGVVHTNLKSTQVLGTYVSEWLSVPGLDPGEKKTIYCVETDPPAGHVAHSVNGSPEVYPVTVTAPTDANKTALFAVEAKDPYLHASFAGILQKVDKTTKKPLAGAKFKLTLRDSLGGNVLETWTYKTENDGTITFGKPLSGPAYISSKSGLTWFPVGYYEFEEIEAPVVDGVQYTRDPEILSFDVGMTEETRKANGAAGIHKEWEWSTQRENTSTSPVSLKKVSSNPSITDNNSMYSVEGAKFVITKTDGTASYTFTCKADGTTDAQDVLVGTYTVQETYAPKGYKENGNIPNITVKSGVKDTQTFTVSDEPEVKTVDVAVQKTTKGLSDRNRDYSDARFKIEYFDNETSTGTPKRTWVFAADEEGQVTINDVSKVSGDALWKVNGKVVFPLGSVKITETVAPNGLVRDDTPKAFPLTKDNSVTFETVTFQDEYIFGGVKINKYTASLDSRLASGDSRLDGAVFGIYNASDLSKVVKGSEQNLIAKGGLMATITTDKNGFAQCGAILEAGTYTIKEISAPEGYLKNENFSLTFTISSDGQIVDETKEGTGTVPEDEVTGGLKVQKSIKDGDGQGDAKLSGAQFIVTNKSSNPVKVKGTVYHFDDVVMTLTTDENGKAETGANVLPYGTYEVKETVAPEGCDKDDSVQTVEIRTQNQYDTVPYTWQEPIVRGNIEVLKYDYDRNEEALKQGDAVLTGAKFEIYNKSANSITYITDNGATKKTVEPNGLIDTIETNEKGIAATEPNSLPYGTYQVTEVKAPDGYTQEGENLSFTLNIRESGKTSSSIAKNRVVRGGLSLVKVDSDIDDGAQGEATLEGAEFSIINRSADAVKVNGTVYAPGQVVMKIYTDEEGKASTGEKDLPYGTYEVQETGNPKGYHVDTNTSTVEIREEGKVVPTQYTFVEKVYRGDFDIKKVDKDANIGEFAQGDATLKGATFQIVSLNEQPVMVDGVVYNENDVVKTIVTDEKGHAFTEGKTFPYGTYYYEEIESPKGYLLSGVRLSGNFTIDVDGEVETRSYESNNGPMDDVIRGGFELAKVDNDTNTAYAQGDASLEGAEFTLYNRSVNAVFVDTDDDGTYERYEAGAVITRYYTDANGKIVVSGRVLPYGRYELVETGSSEGYQIDGNNLRQPFSIEKDGQIAHLTGENATTEKVQLFGFEGGKWDLELNAEKVIQGTASLEGATVELVNKSAHSVVVEGTTYAANAVVRTFTTDKDGKFSIGEVLPYGTYTLNETKAPEGYALKGSKVSYTFRIVENEDKTYSAMGGYEDEELSEIPMSGHIVDLDTENSAIKDQVYRGDISIHKLEGQLSTDDPTDLLKPIEGVRFEISLVKSWTDLGKKIPDETQFVTAIVTNKDGYASTKTLEGRNPLGYLPYGWYMIHEDPTTTPSHLTPAEDKFVYVGMYNGNYVQSMDYEGMYVNNKQTETLIKLVKKDKESGETVALAGAKFRILDDTFHVVSFRVTYPKFDTLTEFTTDENGEVSLPEKLKYGTYYLEELGAPTGYLKGEKIQFNVDTFGSFSPDDMLQVNFYDDEAHGRIKLNKTDKFTGEAVEGAVYGVYAAEDIVTPDGVKHASKGDKVDEMVTDANGYAESVDLYLNKGESGNYIVKEIAAPLGFSRDEKEYPVTVTYKDDKTPIVYTSIDTVNTPTVLKLYKTDIDGLKLKGITFDIYRIGGSEGTGIDFAGKFTGGQVKTGTDGLLEVDYVPSGIYEIYETDTLPGYVLDDTVRYFTVDENGKIYESDKDGNKVDADAVASDTVEMQWVNDYTKVIFSKTDVTGEKELGGAMLEVYDDAGNKVYSWTSVEGEEHRIDKVPLGHYTLRETLAANGYVIASDVEFDVVNTGVLQKVHMVDKIMEARKVDTNGKNVVGAKMEVREVLTSGAIRGKVVYSDVLDSWVTNGKAHRIEGLTVGHTYVLLETEAPEGWVLASPVTFTVDDDKKDQEISMVDIQMKANKYDETKKEYVIGAKLEVQTTKGEVVDSWTTDGSYHYISGLVAGKSYVLVETFAPDGYAIANPVNFTVYDNGTEQEVTMINKKVLVYKTNTNVTEIKGAHLEVRDANGNVVDSWVSDGKAHAIVGLKVGLTYTLVETLAPEGYAIALPITFTVEDDAKNTKINLINKRVFMSKVDVTGENEVPGASMVVYDMEGNEVDSWVSGEQPHAIKNLVVGETYRLHEVAAPNGYVVSSDFEFTVADDKQNQTVKMTDKQLFVSKSDITGQKELVGAKLTVIEEATNKVVDSWTSTKDQHAVSGLHVNKWYILREEVAPDGYVIASDVRFFVDDDGQIQRVQMKDKQMMASKKSVTGEDELPGATLVVLDKEGNELDRWVSGDKVHAIKNLRVNETYTLREITAPNGYVIANDVEFTVLDDFQIQTVIMKDKQLFVSKKSVTGEDELEGAKLHVTEKGSDKVLDSWTSGKEAHAVNNLKVGKTYILTEETAPKGYVIASSIEFTVLDDFQIQTVTMVDKIMTAHKVSADGKYVEGAKMEVRKYITDTNGYEVLDKWTTEKDKSHDIENLRVGETYTLVEVEAPKGWVLATPIEFTVEDDGKDQNINMVDVRVSAHKYDETVEKYVEGANLEVRNDKGEVVDSWVTGKDFHYIENLVAGKSYTLVETKAPKGYAIAKPVAFTVVDNGEDQKVVMINKKVLNYKVDTKVEMLPGAELEVRDKEGNVVDKWTSDGSAHEIENLKVGETYTLVEVKAPEGYAIATPITFTVADDAKNESFNMIDKQVFVSKKTVTGQDELPGAKLKVRDKVTGEVVDSWVSGKDQHAIKNLYVGKTYELVEETAPDGYVIAESIDFTVTDDATNQLVEMKDKQLFISKIDVTGEKELPGASLKVTDSNGNVTDEWVSTDTPHAVKNLRVNETYTLTEVTAPNGYAIATSIEFKVLNDFKIQTVTMKDKQVFVSKKAVTGKDELPGAELTVTDVETNKVVDKWTSGKEEHAVENLIVGKEYVLTEVTAPKGYAIATSIKFTVLDDFKVQKVEMLDKQVFVHKTDVTGEVELPNAKLEVINKETKDVVDSWTSGKEQHAIENLVVGETYILRESTAPKGYAVATEIEFTVLDDFKIQTVTMIDKQVFVHKTDVTGEDEVAGAELTVIDKETNKSVDSWTSGTEEHAIENLVVGKTYILREVTAPEGYAIATDIEFTVLDDYKIQSVTMVDQRVKVEKFDEKVKDYLPGAKLEIRDADGKVVDSWVSGKEFHYANNLVVGKTYTLVEVEAPEGYAIATPITFLVEDNKADMTVKMIDKQVITSKVDTVVKQLKGAELEVRDMKGNVVDKWTSDGTPHKIKNLVVGQTYVLVEVKAPEGYAIATPITFKVTDDATNQEFNLINKQVFVFKKDTAGNDMKGAKLSVVAQDGSVVDTWVSDGTAHAVSNISVGATYKLRENEAPEGYVIATDVEFLVQDDFTNQDVVMTDKQLFVSKKDVTGDDELPGATLSVTDADGNELDKWVSTNEAHAVKGLRAGAEYTLTEITAPEGYAIAKSIKFTVNDDFAIQTVTMIDKQVTISKVDITGKEIPGATLTVTDKETGDVVDELVSDETPHPIKNIVVGKTYILTEKLAPNGFVKAEDIEFTVEDDFTVQHVEMKDKYVEISKTDIAGDEIEGAELTVTDKETGKVVDKWTSTKESHKVNGLEVGKTYILTEVVAPKDYSIAESIEFTVDNDFNAQHVTMKDKQVKISKRDITTGDEIEGAKLTVLDKKGNKVDTWTSKKGKDHYITGLKVGETYILREVTAPNGYVRAEDIEFTVKNDFKVQTVVMKDDYTKVKISKQDITNSKELPGATLVIKDSKGKEIEKWTSTDEAHYIEKLPVGKYVLTEITAPDGYEVAEDVEFEVKETGEIQEVVMKDSPKPTPTPTPTTSKTGIPQTGENVGYLVGAVVVIALAAVVLVLVNRKKKSKKDEESEK